MEAFRLGILMGHLSVGDSKRIVACTNKFSSNVSEDKWFMCNFYHVDRILFLICSKVCLPFNHNRKQSFRGQDWRVCNMIMMFASHCLVALLANV